MIVRRALGRDAVAVARVHVRTWQVGYAGLLPQAELDALDPQRRAQRYTFDATDGPRTYLADLGELAAAIAGFVTVSEIAGHGRVSALYVDPDHWRGGIGSALMRAARDDLFRHGCRDATLWVLAGNNRAERFYQADGWAPTGRTRRESVLGEVVSQVQYRTALTG